MLRVRNKRKFNEVSQSKENLITPAKKKTMDLGFSFTNPALENNLKQKAMEKKKNVKILGSCENRLPVIGKKQPSIKDFYSTASSSKNKIKVYEEKSSPKIVNDLENGKPKELNSFQLLCQKEAPEKYWEMLAEERRKALEYALEENKKLAEEIDVKDKTIHELEEEVEELKETATHVEYLASVIEDLGGSDEVGSQSVQDTDTDEMGKNTNTATKLNLVSDKSDSESENTHTSNTTQSLPGKSTKPQSKDASFVSCNSNLCNPYQDSDQKENEKKIDSGQQKEDEKTNTDLLPKHCDENKVVYNT